MAKIGSIIGHRIDSDNEAVALRGQRQITGKNWPRYPSPLGPGIRIHGPHTTNLLNRELRATTEYEMTQNFVCRQLKTYEIWQEFKYVLESDISKLFRLFQEIISLIISWFILIPWYNLSNTPQLVSTGKALRFRCKSIIPRWRRRGSQVVSALDFRTEGQWFEACLCRRVVSLDKKIYSTLWSLYTQVYTWVPAIIMLGVTPRTSHPGGSSWPDGRLGSQTDFT